MSKELFLNPFKRDAAPKQISAVAPADLRLLPSHELATQKSALSGYLGKVLPALSAHFKNFHASGLSKAAISSMHGSIKGDLVYLPMLCEDSNAKCRVRVRRIVLSLANPHEKNKHSCQSVQPGQ
jgi:hypothetical protein